MGKVIELEDAGKLVKTDQFPHAHFPFEEFNPPQSRVFEIFDKDANAVIASATSSGKTTCAEMFISHEIRKRGGKGIYLAPLKALSKEKLDDWGKEDHHFADLDIAICTGDFRLTKDRRQEMEDANIIVMTSEMLNSRCRNIKSESNGWLKDVDTIVVDESHLLTVPSRGDHLEVGLMKFSDVNPDSRLVFLSATLPNVNEICGWMSNKLTSKDTYYLKSTYRPCPLLLHFEEYWDGGGTYDENEENKVTYATQIIDSYPSDKFLVFVHTKRTGKLMKQHLEEAGINCEFHYGDLSAKKRYEVEDRFKNDPNTRVVVATSTLAWGVNLPARRVVITGVHRGLDEVAGYDIHQEVGRAGRPKYDPAGDAYILVPKSKADYHKTRIMTPEPILSQMLDDIGGHHKVLAFHIVSEIHHGYITTREDLHDWYDRSLAAYQSMELEEDVVNKTLDLLSKCGAIWEEDGEFKVNAVGKISSLFYFSPFDVADLRKNFDILFSTGNDNSDFWVAMALGNLDSHRMNIVSRAERESMASFAMKVGSIFGKETFKETAIKAGFCYYQMLHGNKSEALSGYMAGLKSDFPRLIQVLHSIDSMSKKWKKRSYFNRLELRAKHGVPGHLVHLCEIPDIAKVRASRLYNAGLATAKDVANNPAAVKSALKATDKMVKKICDAASKKSMK